MWYIQKMKIVPEKLEIVANLDGEETKQTVEVPRMCVM